MSTFRDGQKIVNTLVTDGSLTQGRIYFVVNSYDGVSGCGPQEWVRVVNDRGHISGYDPDRFIPYVGDQETANALACALHVRSILGDLAKGFQGPLFAEARKRVGQAHQDIDSIIGIIADAPYPEQIGIGALPFEMIPEAAGPLKTTIYEVAIQGAVMGWLVRTGPAKSSATPHDGEWFLYVDEVLRPLASEHWEDAYKEARQTVEQVARMRGYHNIDLWAKQRRFAPTLPLLLQSLREQADA